MQRNFKHILLFTLVLALALPVVLMAQTTTGRISGVVRDKETGEPLPGANVLIVGSTMGAATDINGEYIVQNVPVGVYTIQSSFVGYATMKVENIRVRIGLTERLNFDLTSAAIEGEAVTIVAERPLIEKTATNTSRTIDLEQVQNLPVRGVVAIAVLNPGIVYQDDNIYIRGSRNDAVGYYLEGVSVRDISNAGNNSYVIQEALEEAQFQIGGYSAQYGGANAGVVATVLRSGTSDYSFSYRAETDNFTKMNEKRFGTYSYGYSDHVLTASGPIPGTGNKGKFFAAGENYFIRDNDRKFWSPFKFENGVTSLENGEVMWLVDSKDRSGPGDTLDVIEWKGGNTTVGNALNRFSGNGVLTYDMDKIKLRLSGVATYQKWSSNNNPIDWLFATERFQVNERSTFTGMAKITHFLSPKAFYTLSLAYHDWRGKNYDPFLKLNVYGYSDSLVNAQLGFPEFRTHTQGPPDYDIYKFPFQMRGTIQDLTPNVYKRNYIGGNLDATLQFKRHQVMFGGEFQYWTLRQWFGQGGSGVMAFLRNDPDILKDQERLDKYFASLGPNYLGYDLYGNQADVDLFFSETPHPMVGAMYLQDRYEFQDLVINAGVRFDYYQMDQYQPKNFLDPGYERASMSLDPAAYEKTKASLTASPRIGFAFPVTDRTKLHAQWGKFVAMPQMTQVYRSNWNRASQLGGGYFYTDPMAWNVSPERTTQYELGFAHQFASNASFDVVLFYKDIKDQLQTRRVFASPESGLGTYDITLNGDFATTKGLEFRYTMRRTNRVMGWINYTFAQARGTGSYTNQASASLDQQTNQITVITPLMFHNTHNGTVDFDYRFGQDDGGPVLEQLGLNMLFRFNSGHPFTYSGGGLGQIDPSAGAATSDTDARARRPREPIGASTTPWNFYLDGRLDKTFSFGRFDINVYVNVLNILNTKNVINVWPRTGSADSDGFLEDADLSSQVLKQKTGPGYKKMLIELNNNNRRNYLDLNTNRTATRGDDLWGQPREIRFGIYITY